MENPETLIRQIKELVGSNRTKEALELLDQAELPYLDKELTLLKSRFHKLAEDQRLGILDDKEARLEINKINLALLGLSENIRSKEAKAGTIASVGKPTKLNYRVFGIAFIVIAVLAGGTFWVMQKPNVETANGSMMEQTAEAEEQPVEAPEEANPNAPAEQAWEQATATDNVEAYRTYLQNFPNGEYAKEASGRLQQFDDQDWKKALNEKTVESFQNYLTSWANGKHRQQAMDFTDMLKQEANQKKLEDEAWKRALSANTVEAYQAYLLVFPQGIHSAEAKKKINKINEDKRKQEQERILIQKRNENSRRQIKISLIRLYCEKSDDEGAGNDADMAEFRFKVKTSQKSCNPSSKAVSSNAEDVYSYASTHRTTPKGYNWPLTNNSATITFDNQHCNAIGLNISGYAREADGSSNDETASNSISVNLSGESSLNKNHSFRLSSEDFTYYCEFSVEKIGTWKFGEKY